MGEMILKGLRELGHDPRTLGKILLTHVHYDHAGSAAFLQSQLGAEVFCHPDDAESLVTGQALRETFGPAPGLLNRLLYETFVSGNPTTIAPLQADCLLEDGEEVIGGIQAIHTPGHCQGHLAFLWRDNLIAGDAASNVGWLRAAIGTENHQRALGSIQKLCLFDFEAACFGHGPPIKTKADQRFRAREWFSKADRHIVHTN